jgi:hypothetical protein
MGLVTRASASVPAGIEAPIRFYVTESDDGTAALAWRWPSAVFAPYGSEELDVIWTAIVGDTLGD